MLTARTRPELDLALRTLRRDRAGMARVALVPTMGALHAGHMALIEAARAGSDAVVASIFVNPLQFEQAADLERYPRAEAADLEMLQQAGCDAVWLPPAHVMYPAGDATVIDVGGPALHWEGAARPGHFRGVATVVAKLFGQVRPDVALFGEKDWQQLQVIRRMTTDLGLAVRVEGVATAREAGGLAMSSRNRFLSAAQRRVAPVLPATLAGLASALRAGGETAALLARANGTLRQAGFEVDYLALVDGPTLAPVVSCDAATRLIAAARLGEVRLLDNMAVAAAPGGAGLLQEDEP